MSSIRIQTKIYIYSREIRHHIRSFLILKRNCIYFFDHFPVTGSNGLNPNRIIKHILLEIKWTRESKPYAIKLKLE